jgi:hypothetical protein
MKIACCKPVGAHPPGSVVPHSFHSAGGGGGVQWMAQNSVHTAGGNSDASWISLS